MFHFPIDRIFPPIINGRVCFIPFLQPHSRQASLLSTNAHSTYQQHSITIVAPVITYALYSPSHSLTRNSSSFIRNFSSFISSFKNNNIISSPQHHKKQALVYAADQNDTSNDQDQFQGMTQKEIREFKAKEREARILENRRQRQLFLDQQAQLKDKAPPPLNAPIEQDVDTTNQKGLFSFVTNNSSSKNAIDMGKFQGDGGNVGEMMKAIRGRGRTEEGQDSSVEVGNGKQMRLFYRKMLSSKGMGNIKPATVVMVHGILSHSWIYRDFMQKLSKDRYDCYAPDWIGCGYSEWPQPGFSFSFSEEKLKALFGNMLNSMGLQDKKITLVVQGFVLSQYALLWAIENPSRIEKVVILNTPLTSSSKLPFVLQQYKLPLVADFVAQDAMRSERFLEAGGPYVMDIKDADRYREPFLESMMPGLATIDILKKAKYESIISRIRDGFVNSQLPVYVMWGTSDKYLKTSDAKAFCDATGAKLKEITQAGFLVQNDWPEKIVDAFKSFNI